MDMRKILGYPHEKMTRDTAKTIDMLLTDKIEILRWVFQAQKARRHAVPKTTENKAKERFIRARVYGSHGAGEGSELRRQGSTQGSSKMIALRPKWVRFLTKKSDSTVTLRSFVATSVTPAGLKIERIRTDQGGDFS